MTKLTTPAVISLVTCSCQERKKPYRERFERYYNINIKRCVEAIEEFVNKNNIHTRACDSLLRKQFIPIH